MTDDGTLLSFPLRAGDTRLLGRDETADFIAPVTGVSRHHCRFEPSADGRHRVVDLLSTNGSYVNDQRVSSRKLSFGDRIRVGPLVLAYISDNSDSDAAVQSLELIESTINEPPSGATPRPSLTGGSEAIAAPERRLRDGILQLSVATQDVLSEQELTPLLNQVLRFCLLSTGADRGAVVLGQDPESLRRVTEEGELKLTPELRDLLQQANASGELSSATLADGTWALCAPIEPASEGALGGLLLHADGACDPSTQVRELLRITAAQLTMVLERAQFYQDSIQDKLTGLENRASIERALRRELGRLSDQPGSLPVSVILFDLDHFKQVNDTYGHPVGDEVLREVAERSRNALRGPDRVGRWGGEEFLAILPGTDLQGAEVAASKIAKAISAEPIGEAGITITTSAGVACAPMHGQVLDVLLRRADFALYAAKQTGRDKVLVFRPEMREVMALPNEPEGGAGAGERFMQTVKVKRSRGEAFLWVPTYEPVRVPRQGVVRIGRSPDCELRLEHPNVSSLHATVRRVDDAVVLKDEGSTNGTFHKWVRVHDETILEVGDAVVVGPFEVRVLGSPDVPLPGLLAPKKS
ncbi:MAG: diguanylate cyclase [Planctomycetes bacterium]|nr:diguanylate cyclase [Planctomycetota bacterium]